MIFKPITSICLNVTEQCNLACRYCFTQHTPHKMSYQVAKDAADWVRQNAAMVNEAGDIGFFGGEPLLEWDTIIVPLTKYIREECRSGMNLSITSNCLLLNQERLEFMRKYGIGLLVSVDGDKTTQDYNRPCKDGRSSFDILKDKLPMILEYFPDATFRSTLIPDTCQYFCENLEFAKNIGFNHAFVIIDEFQEWPDEKRKIVEQQVRSYSNYLISCCRQNKGFIRQRTLEQALNKIIAVNTNIRARQLDRIQLREEGRVCGTGIGYGSVNYKGDIFSCQEVASREGDKDVFYIGNIYTGTDNNRIKELHDRTNNIKVVNSKNTGLCEECPLEAVCDVNTCVVNNYLANKDFGLQPDSICWWHNLMAREAQYICQILGEENNPMFRDYFKWIITSEGGCLNHG